MKYAWQEIEDRDERREACKARHDEIREKLETVFEQAGDDYDMSKVTALGGDDKLGQVRALTAELKALEEPEPHPGHYTGGRGGSYPVPGRKSSGWGESFLKQLGGRSGRKDLTPSGSIVVPSLIGSLIRDPQRPTSLLALVPTSPLRGADTWWYLKETVYTNNAAAVAAGSQKPTSSYGVAKTESTVKTIAHLTDPISRFDLQDAPMLSSYVDTVLREGVELAFEDEILNGSGIAPHIRGILNTVGIGTIAYATDLLTTSRKAVTKLQTQNIPLAGCAFVLNPHNWEALELTTATGSGEFLMGAQVPVDAARQRLWGVPVVTSMAIAMGTGLLCDFAGSTVAVEREGVQIDWSEAVEGSVSGVTAFESNELIFRGEGRFDFAVTRPRGVVTMTSLPS